MTQRPVRVLHVAGGGGDARLAEMLMALQDSDAFAVTGVMQVEAAEALLEQDDFDVVLLDLTRSSPPGMFDGTTGHVVNRGMPVVVVADHPTADEGLALVQRGADDCLDMGSLGSAALARAMRAAVERRRLRRARDDAEFEQRWDRVISALERAGNPQPSTAGTRASGAEPLAVASPETFSALVEQYCALIERAAGEREDALDRQRMQGAPALAQRLGFLRASPRDVVDLHRRSLEALTRSTSAASSRTITEQAWLVLLALTGSLTSYYRGHMLPVNRAGPSPRPQTQTV